MSRVSSSFGVIMSDFGIKDDRAERSDELVSKSPVTVCAPVGGADSFGVRSVFGYAQESGVLLNTTCEAV